MGAFFFLGNFSSFELFQNEINASVMFITGQILKLNRGDFVLHSSALIIIFLIIGTGRSSIFFLGHKLCPSNNNRDWRQCNNAVDCNLASHLEDKENCIRQSDSRPISPSITIFRCMSGSLHQGHWFLRFSTAPLAV